VNHFLRRGRFRFQEGDGHDVPAEIGGWKKTQNAGNNFQFEIQTHFLSVFAGQRIESTQLLL